MTIEKIGQKFNFVNNFFFKKIQKDINKIKINKGFTKNVKIENKQISLNLFSFKFLAFKKFVVKKIVIIKKRCAGVSFPYSLTLFISIKNKDKAMNKNIFKLKFFSTKYFWQKYNRENVPIKAFT